MIRFKDFAPRMVSEAAFLKTAEYESFDEALQAANAWIHENKIKVLNIETVVLPNI